MVITANCKGDINPDGKIDLTLRNGQEPYTFDWHYDGVGDNDDPEDLIDVVGGTYLVNVSDANGLFRCLTITIPSDDNKNCPCNIFDIGLDQIKCNDNGTPFDAIDDYVEFDLNPTGTKLTSSYTLTVDGHTSFPFEARYSQKTHFRLENGSASNMDSLIRITITDSIEVNCTKVDTFINPGNCLIDATFDPELDQSISVFPNPSSDFITINIESDIVIDAVMLIDISGKQVLKASLESSTFDGHTISVSHIPNGLYRLRMQIGQSFVDRKIVIIK